MSVKNNIYTLSYFRKRLFESGISSKILINKFERSPRYWMCSIYPDIQLICTCFKHEKDFWLSFSDGKNRLSIDHIIKTESMNVIIDWLKNFKNHYHNEKKIEIT